jgi:hypothetical protein
MNCNCNQFDRPVLVGSGSEAICVRCRDIDEQKTQAQKAKDLKIISIYGKDNFVPMGDYVYADEDGICSARKTLSNVRIGIALATSIRSGDENIQDVDLLINSK